VTRRFLVEPYAASAEPFRTLRLAVEARAGTKGPKRLLFTSPRTGDGSSTVAANYAVVAALVHRPVLLIDADMRAPSLHEMFEVPREPGLVDVLRENLDISQVSHQFPALGGLHLLTAGSPLPSPGDVVASAAMGALLQRAQSEYEAVVIDSPPMLLAADAAGLASHLDTDVVVVVSRAGRRRQAVSALRKLALTDASVLGLVVNRHGAPYADLYY
jgi:capsular exopolysaccharide synthesis family protein